MTLFEDTNPRPLLQLLTEIDTRTTVLPDFQRGFVWEPRATRDLIVSIANNFPAGSILRVRDTQRVFAVRVFEGAPELSSVQHTFLVLDGQQRLTSLYQAFYGVGEHRYYIDLNKLIHHEDFDDAVFHVRANTKWCKEREKFDVQVKEMILPLSVMHKPSGFLNWQIQAITHVSEDKRLDMLHNLSNIYDKWLKMIENYQFPVVTLSAQTEADALCTIFETLNRTGVKLSAFELLTARFWPKNISLRQLWDQACDDFSIIKDYDVDPYYLLQAISLVSKKNPSCTRKDVLNLDVNDITTWWDKVVKGFARVLEIIRDDCHVLSPKWMPYQTVLPPLAAVYAQVGLLTTTQAAVHRTKVRQWFWCVVFGQVYEFASNSQSAKDYPELLAWIGGSATAPENVVKFPSKFNVGILRTITSRQGAVYRGVICLMLENALDFHTAAPITAQMLMNNVDDHHIFPAAYLNEKGISARQRDCVLNRTLIDATTNRMIGRRAPSDYLQVMKNTDDFPFQQIMASHGLSVDHDSPLLRDDFESFIAEREKYIWHKIQVATGLISDNS